MQTKYLEFTGKNYDESYNSRLDNDFLDHIFMVHGIVAYYSWLSSYTADELFDTTKNQTYKELTIACPVDVYVRDANNVLVCSIVNDAVMVDTLEANVENGVKTVYLPTDQTYSLKIEASGAGNISYTVKEMEVTGEESLNETLGTADRILRTVSFDNIDITAGDTLTGSVDDPFSIPANDYALTKNSTEIIYPSNDIQGPRLPAPTNLTWGKACVGNSGVLQDIPGGISGEVSADTDYVRACFYQKNDDGSDTYITGGDCSVSQIGNKFYFSTTALIDSEDDPRGNHEELKTGTYYFTATARNEGGNSSETVTSPDWQYTRPNKRLEITDEMQASLTLQDWRIAWNKFSNTNQVLRYNVEVYYSKNAVSNPTPQNLELCTPALWSVPGIFSFDNGSQVGLAFPDNHVLMADDFHRTGYFYTRFHIISSDITQISNSDWSNLSPAFYYKSSESTPSTPNYSNSSSGSSSSNQYSITIHSPILNGTVTTKQKYAERNSKISIIVTPDSNYKLEELVIKDTKGNLIAATNSDSSRYEFTMPSSNVTVNATFTPSNQFRDVIQGAYYADAVRWAIEQGITAGTSTTTFSPDTPCTRAQTVTFLWRAVGSPTPQGDTNPFTDVQPNSYYYDAVLWAVEQGITAGTSTTTFSPDATVTRGQAVTFLYRAAGSPTVGGNNPFGDVASDTYYTNAIRWAVDKGVTAGISATTFAPNVDCTRAQIVTFLYRDQKN